MARADIEPREPAGDARPPRGPEASVGRAIAGLYRFLGSNRWTRFPWAVVQTFSRAQGALLSGSMAYYTFLSLLPLLIVASFVLGKVAGHNPGVRQALLTAVVQIFPEQQAKEVLGQLVDASVPLGLFGVVSVAYAGSGFVGALTACMNQMWGVASGRNPVRQKVVNLAVVMLLAAVLLASVGLSLWVTATARNVLGVPANAFVSAVQALASPVAMLVVLLLVYRLLPARRHSWLGQLPGAVFGAAGFEVLKRAFGLWASHSAGVPSLPRSLVSVVLLLVWMGFFGQVILYGAALNVVRDRQRRRLDLLPDPPA